MMFDPTKHAFKPVTVNPRHLVKNCTHNYHKIFFSAATILKHDGDGLFSQLRFQLFARCGGARIIYTVVRTRRGQYEREIITNVKRMFQLTDTSLTDKNCGANLVVSLLFIAATTALSVVSVIAATTALSVVSVAPEAMILVSNSSFQ